MVLMVYYYGKTTLLRIIGGFEVPSGGEVLFEGKNIVSEPPYKRRINTVFQKYALFPHMNVAQNIAFGLNIKKLDKKVIETKVNEMLELVNLKGYENRSINSLSGGQQQRIAIARAMYKEPEILIFDEATSSLDSISERYVKQTLNLLAKRGKTIIVIAHRLSTVKNADKIVVIDKGMVAETGTHQELFKSNGMYNRLWNEQFDQLD